MVGRDKMTKLNFNSGGSMIFLGFQRMKYFVFRKDKDPSPFMRCHKLNKRYFNILAEEEDKELVKTSFCMGLRFITVVFLPNCLHRVLSVQRIIWDITPPPPPPRKTRGPRPPGKPGALVFC